MAVDIDHLRTWIGRTQTVTERIHAEHLAGLSATLDRDDPSPKMADPVPPAGHWIYFNSREMASDLGLDGHPKRGDFLPPVDLPRRMWAGGRINWLNEMQVGEVVTRKSTIADVICKPGKSGDLVFVLVKHQYSGSQGVCIEEEQDIVYRAAPSIEKPQTGGQPAPRHALWTRTVNPDPVLLFRYSALTFNGHRIHYDLPYVTEEEGYPGLIVHGPLIATLLMDLCRRECADQILKQFDYRAMSPLIHSHPFTVNGMPGDNGKSAELWAANSDGRLAMRAEAKFLD